MKQNNKMTTNTYNTIGILVTACRIGLYDTSVCGCVTSSSGAWIGVNLGTIAVIEHQKHEMKEVQHTNLAV